MAAKSNLKQTTVHHITGMRFVGITPDQQRVMIDGSQEAKTGMNPMELLLNAVGACAAFDISEMVRKRRLDLRSYRVELEGTRAEESPRYYTHIHAKHIFDAPGLTKEMAERFVDLGMNKYCSVASSLKAEMSFDVVLEHDQQEDSAA
jgi:putative redox protein